jgi:hypothetical protein
MKVKKIIAGFYEIDTDCGHVFQAEKMSHVTGDAHDGWILSMKVPDIFGEFVFDDIRIEETLADLRLLLIALPFKRALRNKETN